VLTVNFLGAEKLQPKIRGRAILPAREGWVSDESLNIVKRHLAASRDVVGAAIADPHFVETIVKISALVTARLRAGNKVLFAGNGGSAADAQHIAGEFVSRLNYDRDPIAGLALTTDSSVLTAIGNDYGYQHIFSRQIRGLGRAGDIFIAISTSGRSPNILAAVAAAKELGIHTVGFTGSADTELAKCSDIALRAPSSATPLIQQVHIMAAHAICELVELSLFPKGGRPG
jgi:D-sedoheptulose 7-phosphate isomerase